MKKTRRPTRAAPPAGGAVAGAASPGDASLEIRARTDALERSLVLEALRRTGGRKRDASGLRGIDPRNFAYYLRKHDLAPGPEA